MSEAQPVAKRPILVRGGHVISLAADLPAVIEGDVLVHGDHIVGVGPAIEAPGADIVDARERIVIPGLVNAHLHNWQTGLRGACADWAIADYLRIMHGRLAPRYTPEDVRLGALAGALNQINNGTTTIGDWCHNNPTPEHSDADLDGLAESGIRALFLHGSPKPKPRPGQPDFSHLPHPRREIERLARGGLAGASGLVTLGMAILGPHFSMADVAKQDLRLAREFGLVASMHQGGGPAADPAAWDAVEAAGLLGPHLNLVHANNLADDHMRRLVDAGVSFTSTPEVEMSMGHGVPVTARLLTMGGMPSLGVDVESVVSGEMLTVSRFALAQQRMAVQAVREPGRRATSLEALRWATIGGAQALGLAASTGSLERGKQADLVMIDTRALNLTPMHDPVATALQANPANIEAVMIAGVWRKRDGRLLHRDIDGLRSALTASGRRILADDAAAAA